jgi:hypothetical protein
MEPDSEVRVGPAIVGSKKTHNYSLGDHLFGYTELKGASSRAWSLTH